MLIEFKGHKIFAFSDTHGMYRRLAVPADADILICAGDACEGFNPADLQDFFEWYGAIPAKLRIFVPGNHDRIFNTDPVRARNLVRAVSSFWKTAASSMTESSSIASLPARTSKGRTPCQTTSTSSLPTAQRMATWTTTRATRTCTSPLPRSVLNTTFSVTSTRKDYKERQCLAAPPFSMFRTTRL